MNREILFRGKRLESGKFATEKACEWVYGGYAKDCSGEHIYSTLHSRRMVKVVPDTIGQYTGLTDKNGVKIFEGDIVQNRGKFGTSTGVIVFCYGRFMVDWRIRSPWTGKGISARTDDLSSGDEVVGNISDNPDLLEKAK